MPNRLQVAPRPSGVRSRKDFKSLTLLLLIMLSHSGAVMASTEH